MHATALSSHVDDEDMQATATTNDATDTGMDM